MYLLICAISEAYSDKNERFSQVVLSNYSNILLCRCNKQLGGATCPRMASLCVKCVEVDQYYRTGWLMLTHGSILSMIV